MNLESSSSSAEGSPAAESSDFAAPAGRTPAPAPAWRRWATGLLKLIVVAVLLGALIYPQENRDNFQRIWSQEKHWGLMTAAAVLGTSVVAGTYFRWWILIRALGIPCSLYEAVRLGFLSNLFSFIGVGLVGGDVFKAYVLSRGHAGRRAEVVASVLADRFLGVLGLLFGVSVIALFADLIHAPSRAIRVSCVGAWIGTLGGFTLLAILPMPFLNARYSDAQLARMSRPVRGAILLLRAVRLYRHQPRAVAAVIAWSAVTHMLLGVVMVLVAAGLGGPTPSLSSQLVIVPLANFSTVLPIPGGLGAFEFAVSYLYAHVPHDPPLTEGQGFLCALGYRAVMVFVGLIGLGFYLAGKPAVDAAVKAAEREEAERERAHAG